MSGSSEAAAAVMQAPDQKLLQTAASAVPDAHAGPHLSLSGLWFLIADPSAKRLMWLETSTAQIEGKGAGLKQAALSEALSALAPQTQKNLLNLFNTVIRKGKCGPMDVGTDAESGIAGISLTGWRYDAGDGRQFVICHPSAVAAGGEGGHVVRGLAPILKHFVENSGKIVMTADNFGYVRYASPGFFHAFGIDDPALCIGRNIAHIPKRVGKTLAALIQTVLARTSSASGKGRFKMPNGDTMVMNYSALFFRLSETAGGVVFTAEPDGHGDADFTRIFDVMTSPLIVVDTKTRKMLAANKAARKAFQLTQQSMDEHPITETLLHPKSYGLLLEAAKKANNIPIAVVVNSLDGSSRNKRIRAIFIDNDDDPPHLVLESRA